MYGNIQLSLEFLSDNNKNYCIIFTISTNLSSV